MKRKYIYLATMLTTEPDWIGKLVGASPKIIMAIFRQDVTEKSCPRTYNSYSFEKPLRYERFKRIAGRHEITSVQNALQ